MEGQSCVDPEDREASLSSLCRCTDASRRLVSFLVDACRLATFVSRLLMTLA